MRTYTTGLISIPFLTKKEIKQMLFTFPWISDVCVEERDNSIVVDLSCFRYDIQQEFFNFLLSRNLISEEDMDDYFAKLPEYIEFR